MAITQNTYTGDGTTVLFSFTFPYLETTDIKVSVNGTLTTAYTLANATTVQFNSAPANGAAIRIYRDTDDSSLASTFFPGSAIRSQDLNVNFTQTLYKVQENTNYTVQDNGSVTLNGYFTFANNPKGPTPVALQDLTTKQYVDQLAFSATGIGDGPKGDIVVSSGGTVWEMNYYKQQIKNVVLSNIDCSLGNYYSKTVSSNTTFTVSNVPTGVAFGFTLKLVHTNGVITWFSGVEWPGGVAPILVTGKTHLFMFFTDDGGTKWRGAYLINYAN